MSEEAFMFNPSSTQYTNMKDNTGVGKIFSEQEEEMQSAILNLRERVTSLEQTCSTSSSSCCQPECCERLTALEARLATLEATAPVSSACVCKPTKLRIVQLLFDNHGPDSALNGQGPYNEALSHGTDAIVKVSSTQEVARFCVDWNAVTGTVLKVICDAPKLRVEGEGWTPLFEISQGELYTFVKEEDGWKGYSGILLI